MGKPVNPSNPHQHPNFEKFAKICTSKCSKNTNTLPGPISFFVFFVKNFKLLKFTLLNTLFQERFLNNLNTQLKDLYK